jgi:flagellar hook-associated protein 2
MADISGISSSSSSSTQLDQLVNAYLQTQQPQIDTLNQKKSNLQTTQTFYNNIYTKLNSLISNLDTFGDYNLVNNTATFTKTNTIDASFGTKTVTSSKTDVITATATNDAVLSTMSVRVDRLASNDILISDQINLNDTSRIANYNLNTAGDHKFDISVNGVTKTITVSLIGTETNEDILKKIANAVNQTTDINVNAAYIKDTSSTGRITFTAKDTGSSNNIVISGTDSILSYLGLNNTTSNGDRTLATDTTAGYMKSNVSDLDAKLNVNGINIYRGSNTISDVLTGVTLNLLKPQETTEQPVTLTTSVNTNSVKDMITTFLSSLNDITSLINNTDKSLVRSENSVQQLKYNIRSIGSYKVASITDANSPQYLSDIGITVDSNGLFSVSDTTKLENYLKDNPQKVANLFTAPDGVISQVNSFIYNLQGTNGFIAQRNSSLTQQIKSTDDKLKETQDKINTQAGNMRKQYTTLLQTYYEAMAQYSSYSAFNGTASTSSSSSSLLSSSGSLSGY